MKGIFHDLQFVFDFPHSTSYKAKKLQNSKVTENGGIISYIVTQKVSLLDYINYYYFAFLEGNKPITVA